jgi:DNA-binding transcriptional LysR family regulator
MDTRQLAAFCTVVERRSFSQAAEQLGVTQPAVSLQIRSLEKRLGLQLLDRSGRRVEPTDAGRRLYRSAQRLLALEEQLLAELGEEVEGELTGRLEIGASTGPGGTVLPVALAEFQQLHPGVQVALSVSDTQRVIEQVARRELELGVVGAVRRHRGVVFEPFFRDEVVLAVPRGHRFADRQVSLDELKLEPLVLMQEGAGVRQVIDDELREVGLRLRDFNVQLELGLQESARSAVLAGYGVTFISRSAIEADVAAGTVAVARVEGLEPSREISLVRSAGRAETRVAQAFVEFARARLAWSSAGASPPCRTCARRQVSKPRCSSRARAGIWRSSPARAGAKFRPSASTRRQRSRPAASSRSAAAARSISARRSRQQRTFRSCRCRRRTRAQSGRRTTACAIRSGRCAAAARARIPPASSTRSS